MISVVTISFNQSKFLQNAVESIRRQRDISWELIIVDPGSTDGSREYAKLISDEDDRIKLIFDSDRGPADGLNKGFQSATGKIVGCLNSDDFYLDNIFERVVAAFANNPNSACVYAHGLILRDDIYRFQSSDYFTLKNYASRRGLVVQQSTFFNRELLEFHRITFNIENRISWDGELLVDIAIKGLQITRVPDVWGVFRIYPTSITGSKKFLRQGEKEFLRMREKILSLTSLPQSQIFIFALLRPLHSIMRRLLNIVRYYKYRKLFK